NKSITLKVDGQSRSIHTSAGTVAGALRSAHISVGPHDLLAPSENSKLHGGTEIVLRRGHLLHLKVNGVVQDLWVNADSVQEAMQQLGFSSSAYVSVSRSQRLDAAATSLTISSPKRLTILVDGQTVAAMSAGPTVRDALIDAGILVGPNDRVIPSGALRDGE